MDSSIGEAVELIIDMCQPLGKFSIEVQKSEGVSGLIIYT